MRRLALLLFLFAACSRESASSGGMSISSPAFENHATIPAKYTCDGANVSPPLVFSGVPAGTESLSLRVHDPDAPGGDFLHWTVTDIPATTTGIAEGAKPPGLEGKNGFGKPGYGGPCPPKGEMHGYIFTLTARRANAVVAKAELMGHFSH